MKVVLGISCCALAVSSAASAQTATGKAAAADKPTPLPGLQIGAASTWTRGLDGLSQRLEVIGLPAMPKEEFVQHIHQHLSIKVHGDSVTVPAGIGINQFERYISPIHTHDGSGTIHIESANNDVFTLGQFFDVWGVRLTADCLGSYCKKGGETIQVSSNGAQVRDVRALPLQDKQEIQIRIEAAPAASKTAKAVPK